MAIHIDIYAHLRKRELIKEGEELKRYVESLEKDANRRLVKGAEGRSQKLIKLNDDQAKSYDTLINASDRYVAATKRHAGALKALDALNKKVVRDDKELEKHLQAVSAMESEVANAMLERAHAGQQLTKSVNDQTRATKNLKEENQSFSKNLHKVNTLVGKNKKEFRDLTRITNKQRRELESLHNANITVVKDNAALARQTRSVGDATAKTTAERKKYNQMVKEGTATAKQFREQTERVVAAHEAERRTIGDTRKSLTGLIDTHREFSDVVDDNRQKFADFRVDADIMRRQIQNLQFANRDAAVSSRGVASAFSAVGEAARNSAMEHERYNRMVDAGTASKETLVRKSEAVTEAYRRESKAMAKARDELRRHRDAEAEAAARRVAGTGGGRGGGGDRHARFDPGRWAARNLGALTPLGMVTPTLVLPLGTAFTQVANAAVAASQAIALVPAGVAAAAAGIGTLQMATAGFGDTVGALMEGDLEKFAEAIQKLSPAAQQTALTIQHLLPEIQGIQQAAQEAFFTNAPQLTFSLTKMLGPMVEDMTTGIATSMNKMMMNVGGMLLTPEGMGDVEAITQNIAAAFQALEPAVTAVAHAFLDLTSVGSSFLPVMADDLAEVAQSFANFISQARDSGALHDFMTQGWEAIKAVGGALLDFGKMLYDVFGLKSQADIQAFRNTMEEMTNVLEVLLRTMKIVFEDIASIFSSVSDFVGQFGVELDDTATILATLAEAWLFVHFLKWGKDALGTVRNLNIALTGTATAAGAAGAAGATGGVVGALGTATAALSNMVGPLAAVAAAAALFEQHFPNFPIQDQPTGENRIFPGWVPILPAWEENIRRFMGDENAPSGGPGGPMPPGGKKKIRNKTTGQTSEIPAGQAPPIGWEEAGPGLGGGIPTGPAGTPPGGWWPGEFPVPGMPTKPGDFQSTPGTFELSNIPIGQFGGAPWNVPPGMMDLPPDYQNLGKTGFYQPDQYKIFQEQSALDEARTRVEEARIAQLAKQADANSTQDDINKAAADVIAAEHDWLDSVRQLKEAERGEFVDLTSQTRSFADDLRDSLGDLGAALDPDLGISKGLAGMAENLVKFVATLGAAPVLGAMKGMQAGLGFPGNKGVGSGLIGMIAAQQGYYESPYNNEDLAQLQLGQQYGIVNPTLGGPVPAQVPSNLTGGLPAGTGGTGGVGGLAAQITAFAQRSSGGTYDLGTSDLAGGLSDCSGAISDLVEIIKKGRADAGRLPGFVAGPNTRETLEGLGAVEGAIPGALQIGWKSGGPAGGHMRATLPNGVPFESGGGTGQGATYGGAAKGAQGMPNIMSILIPGGVPVAAVPPVAAAPPVAAGPPAPFNPNPPLRRDPATGAYFARGGWVGYDDGGMVGGGGGFALPGPKKHDYGAPGNFNPNIRIDTSRASTSGEPYWAKYAKDVLPSVSRPGLPTEYPARDFLSFLTPEEQLFQDMISVNMPTGWPAKPPIWMGGPLPQPPLNPMAGFSRGGSTDTVPAMLTPGEFVVNAGASAKFGSVLERINGYDGGGFVIPPGIIPGKPGKPNTNPLDVFAPTKPPKPPPYPGTTPGTAMPGGLPEGPPPPPGLPPVEGVPHLPAGGPPGLPGPPTIGGVPAPAGVPTSGAPIGAQVAPPQGYGEGLKIGGGIVGSVAGAAASAASMAADAFAPGSGAAASAAIQIGIQEIQRAIEFGAQAAGIGVQGLMETFLPTGGSELAQNSWLTRIAGGIVGAAPALPNLAGGLAQDALGKGQNLPGVGPSTAEQIAAQAMDPNRAQHTGVGPAPGPVTNNGVNIQNYNVTGAEDRAGQDLARYQPIPGAR